MSRRAHQLTDELISLNQIPAAYIIKLYFYFELILATADYSKVQNLFFAGLFFLQCGVTFLLAASFIFFIPHYRDYERLAGVAGGEDMLYHVLAEEELEEGTAGGKVLSETIFPLSRASIWSLIFFEWVWELVDIGYRKPLEMEDVWEIDPAFAAEKQFSRLATMWNEELEIKRKGGQPSLIRALRRNFARELVVASLFWLLSDLIGTLALPVSLALPRDACRYQKSEAELTQLRRSSQLVMSAILHWMDTAAASPDNPSYATGYLLAVLLFGVTFIQQIAGLQNSRYLRLNLRPTVWLSLNTLVYDTMMSLEQREEKTLNNGKLTVLVTNDLDRVTGATTYINLTWSAPLRLVLATFLLYQYLGWACFVCIGVLVIVMPIQYYLTLWQRRKYNEKREKATERIKYEAEILSAMSVLKLYAWEGAAEEKVRR